MGKRPSGSPLIAHPIPILRNAKLMASPRKNGHGVQFFYFPENNSLYIIYNVGNILTAHRAAY